MKKENFCTLGASLWTMVCMCMIGLCMLLGFSSCSDDDEDDDSSADNGSISVSGYNGHDYVDLGLSVKWATCNIGASSPEEYGNYYAWGETSTKSTYTNDNSDTYGDSSMSDFSGDSEYDVATANWGGTWRMPTKTEMQELIYGCTWTWTTQNNMEGYQLTGTNGNSIFLPAAGLRNGSSLDDAGTLCCYWTSTPRSDNADYAYGFGFYSGYRSLVYYDRYLGLAVRPVID